MDIPKLVQKAQAGDTEAFSQLYDYFADRIFRFIRLRIQHKQQAEDVLQEVFLKAWKGLPQVRLQNLNFNAWLYKVAGNSVNDHLRKIYRSPFTLDLEEAAGATSSENVHEQASRIIDAEHLRKNLHELPPQYRQVLELRFLQDFTISETADILGKSNLAVRLLQHRALKQLKIILQKSYDIEHEQI